MSTATPLTLYHSPNSRSTGALILLEELGADYTLHLLNMKKKEQRGADYLAINPMGKVPAIMYGDALVTEQVAVFLYLADLFPRAGLAPTLGGPLRGPYLRWTVFYGSCFEPAIIDRAQKRDPAPPSLTPYGDYDTMLTTLTDQLSQGPYLLGDQCFAVDILWGVALDWVTRFQIVPALPVIQTYIDRINTRPAVIRARAKDAELAAAQA